MLGIAPGEGTKISLGVCGLLSFHNMYNPRNDCKIASSNNDPYKGLLESGLSEQLNDASLVLRVMGRMDDKATLEWVVDKNEEALKQAARDTISLAQSWRGNGWFRSRDI